MDPSTENIPQTAINQGSQPTDSEGRKKLRSWLNKNFRIKMTDGRILIGLFLCTDSDANIILGMCSEYRDEEERTLGLVIVPKKHITSIEVDTNEMFNLNTM